MNDERQKFTLQGKVIDYTNFSGDQLIKLYEELKKREVMLYQRILKNLKELDIISE